MAGEEREAAHRPEGAPGAVRTASGRAAALVTAGILASRLVGLARQRVVAHYFGTGAAADAIAAGFRVGNITQNLLGEGTLSATFIPVYARLRAGGKAGEAARFALAALGFLGLGAFALSAVGVALARRVAQLFAAGFDAERLELTARIVRFAFPMTALLVLSAWGLGVQNAHRRFFLPYAAPVVWSVAQIAGLFVFGGLLGLPEASLAVVLAASALAGAALQLALLFAPTRALLGSIRPSLDRGAPGLAEAASRLPGALVARGVVQLSGLVDTLLVSFVGSGANAAFAYAQTIYLLPMSVLGTGEAAAQLPEMAEASAEEREGVKNAALRNRLGASLARLVALTLPIGFAFACLGGEIVALLLQTGDFDAEATARVKRLLAAYGLALLANAAGRVLAATLYALGDTKTPARFALARVAVSAAIALLLIRPLGALGVVLGAVAAAWVEALALALRVRRRIGGLGLEQVRPLRALALAGACAASGLAARALMPPSWRLTPLGGLLSLAAFGIAFAGLAPALGLFDLRRLLRRR